MNKAITEKFEYWLKNASGDADLANELRKIAKKLEEAKKNNDSEARKKIEADLDDRFYCELEFGTGGLRGIIGAGTNRINHYTVARATQGLADFVKSRNPSFNKPGTASVAVAFDSRHKSSYFARVAAQVLAANGIKCHVYKDITPTPMLSFAVRRLKCSAGIVITASHNPSQYNGYKAYGSDGCQLNLSDSEVIINRINKLDLFNDVELADFDEAYEKGLITGIDSDVIDDYFKSVKARSIHRNICGGSGLKVVFTPLNGAGNKPVRRIFKETGVADVVIVPEQERPDGSFPTCPYPNPEFKEALELGLKLAKEENADLLIATDPDCDRVGLAVRDESAVGGFALFSGNEVGAMMLEYICRERRVSESMPLNPIAVKTIVTTDIAAKIAEKYNVQLFDVLTGFKFIGEIIGNLEKKGEQDRFIFGFEESIGYLAGSYVRDKDAVCASMLICEMAAFYRRTGKTLVDAREQMYKDYGYYYHDTQNIRFEGQAGAAQMKKIMDNLRRSCPKQVGKIEVVGFSDYLNKTVVDFRNPRTGPKSTGLPKSNVLKLVLEDDSVIIVRPSGTEPKLKIYYTSIGLSMSESVNVQKRVKEDFTRLIGV
ncbi:MAG: phospho-sugar mutase [Oscillospiraceae bacterium]|nr:phospho-sugar mutase [Oscillospiraceae bacterium]